MFKKNKLKLMVMAITLTLVLIIFLGPGHSEVLDGIWGYSESQNKRALPEFEFSGNSFTLTQQLFRDKIYNIGPPQLGYPRLYVTQAEFKDVKRFQSQVITKEG